MTTETDNYTEKTKAIEEYKEWIFENFTLGEIQDFWSESKIKEMVAIDWQEHFLAHKTAVIAIWEDYFYTKLGNISLGFIEEAKDGKSFEEYISRLAFVEAMIACKKELEQNI